MSGITIIIIFCFQKHYSQYLDGFWFTNTEYTQHPAALWLSHSSVTVSMSTGNISEVGCLFFMAAGCCQHDKIFCNFLFCCNKKMSLFLREHFHITRHVSCYYDIFSHYDLIPKLFSFTSLLVITTYNFTITTSQNFLVI